MQTRKTPSLALVAMMLAAGLVPLMGLVPQASAVPVQVSKVDWYDVDHNGHLDAVTITLPGSPNCGSVGDACIYPDDFGIGSAQNKATGFSTGDALTAVPAAGAAVNDNVFTLYFPESNSLDAGPITSSAPFLPPSISYQPHTPALVLAGFTSPPSGRNDLAPPILKAAYAVQGTSQFTAVFSEPVSKDGGSSCSGNPPSGSSCLLATPAVPSGDFCFQDAAGGAHPIISITPIGGYPAKAYTFTVGQPATVPNPPGPPIYPSYSMTPEDVQVANLVKQTPASFPYPARLFSAPFNPGASPTCGAPAANYKDKDQPSPNTGGANFAVLPFFTTPAPWFGWPAGAVPVGAPVPMRVHASAGDTHVVAEFTGPVADQFSQKLEVGFSTQLPANWFVGTISQDFGSDRVLIESTVPVPDFSSNLVTQGNIIYGFPNNYQASTPAISWPLSDGVFGVPNQLGATLAAPHIASVEMVDGDANGCIDAMKVTFNEYMDDGAGTVMSMLATLGPNRPATGGDATHLIDSTANFVTSGVTVGNILRVSHASGKDEPYTVTAVAATTLTFSPAAPSPGVGSTDTYRVSAPSPNIGGWTVFWPGFSNTDNNGISVFAATPITGGSGVSGNTRILYTPNGVNDNTIFLTFPATTGLAPGDVDTIPVDINTYGSTNCHVTGAANTELGPEQQLPRVSFCANSPQPTGVQPGFIRDGEQSTPAGYQTFGYYSNARACPALAAGRPTDLAGNQVQFGPTKLQSAGSPTGSSGASGGDFMFRRMAQDTAKPVLVAAFTRDCALNMFTCPSINGASVNYDGKLDGYELVFSEPVADFTATSPFPLLQYQACTTAGTVAGFSTSGSVNNLGTENGRRKWLPISSGTATAIYDTGCVPDLRYTGSPSNVHDVSGVCAGYEGSCAMANTERGPRFDGQVTLSQDATPGTPDTFTSLGFVTAFKDYCPLTPPSTHTCSPAVTLYVTDTLAADVYQVTAFDDVSNAVTFNVAGGTGGASQNSATLGVSSGAAATASFVTQDGLNERDGAGPVLVKLLGTVGSVYGQGIFSEKACAWRSQNPSPTIAAATRTSITYTGGSVPDASWFEQGTPLTISTGAAAGTYTITAVHGSTFDFSPAARAVPAPGDQFLNGCQPPQAADFAYQDNIDFGTAISNVPSHPMPTECAGKRNCDNKMDLKLDPNTGLTEDDIGTPSAPDRDCLQLKAPNPTTKINQYADPGNTFGIVDMAANIGHPEATSTGAPPCRYWEAANAPTVTKVETQDSNQDGYLDALKMQLSLPIRDGTRLLRHDGSGACGTAPGAGDGLAGCGDAIYFDRDPAASASLGVVSNGDLRLNDPDGPGPLVANSLVSCPAADCGTPVDTAYAILWQDVGALMTGSDDGVLDGVWADVDGSNTVSHGDFRYVGQPGYAISTPVVCAAPRSADCGRTEMARYADKDNNGWASSGTLPDTRTAAIPATTVGAVQCQASPDPDCGTGLSPTSYNLMPGDFSGQISVSDKTLSPSCVVSGKGAGPLLGGSSFSSCLGGIVGTADPEGGAVPNAGDSCAGALQSAVNDAVVYICTLVWATDAGVAIPDTGFIPRISYNPSTTRPGGTIRSMVGDVPLGGFLASDNPRKVTVEDGAAPVLVKVEMGAGSFGGALKFSESVAAGQSSANPITVNDLAYINGNSGSAYCQSGVDTFAATGHTVGIPPDPGPDGTIGYPVILSLEGRLSHDDVVGCVQNPPPASTVSARDGIRPTSNIYETKSTRQIVLKTVPFTDRDLPPTLDSAGFIDANGDGTIDAVKVIFSEPVNDCFMSMNVPAGSGQPANGAVRADNGNNPAFPIAPVNCGTPSPATCTAAAPMGCEDPTHRYGWEPTAASHRGDFIVCPGASTTPATCSPQLHIRNIVTGQLGASGPFAASELCKAHYLPGMDQTPLTLQAGESAPTFGPYDGFNDNTVFLCLEPDQEKTGGNPGTKGLPTDTVGSFMYTQPGTLCGNPSVPVEARNICDIADIGPDPTATGLANPVKAPPLTATLGDMTKPVANAIRTDDRDHNGKVDSIHLNLTEPIDPTTLVLADWNIDQGHAVTGFAVTSNLQSCAPTVPATSTKVTEFWLCFAEVAGTATFDTDMGHAPGTGPRVSYAAGGHVHDLAACPHPSPNPCTNAMRAIAGVAAQDGAQPVVVRLQSTVGSATTTITFSEPVDGTGPAGSLSIVTTNLGYIDGPLPATASDNGATALVGNVVHSPGDIAAAVTLNHPATQWDIDHDRIRFLELMIKEHNGNLLLYDHDFALNGVAGDRIPPPPPTNVAATTVTDASIKIEWDTPADTDVQNVEVWVCVTGPACVMNIDNIRAGIQGPVRAMQPRAAARGTHETYLYTPSTTPPWTALTFTVVTADASGNKAMGNTVDVVHPDTGKPEAVSGISANWNSELGDRVVLTFNAPHDDTATEKVAGYRVYKVLGGGPVTAVDANLVSGASVSATVATPGTSQQVTVTGLTNATQYTFGVIPFDEKGNFPDLTAGAQVTGTTKGTGKAPDNSPTAITAAAITQRNLQIKVNATQVAGTTGNVVNWTLPSEDAKHPTMGVQVWRCGSSTTSCVLIANLTKDSAPFKAHSYVDAAGKPGDSYLVTAYYGQGKTPADGFARNSAEGSQIPGFSQLQPEGPGSSSGFLGLPLWLWIVVIGVLILLVALGVILMTRNKRGDLAPPAEAAAAAEGWAPAEGEAAAGEWPAEGEAAGAGDAATEAAAAAAAAEAAPPRKAPLQHYITCPKCSTEFTANGPKPLAIQCPNCGVRGTLR